MKKINNNNIIGMLPAIITTSILLLIYLLKGIYPFGDMTIIHADMGQVFVNNFIYYIESIKNGDFFNFLYSNELNTGTKILGSALPSGFFSPFSLIYLLCKDVRKLPYAMSIFLIIKVAFCASTAYICFFKLFGKENYKFNIIFSVQYALSSYVLINYTNIIWIDVIIIFPLIILALKNIINKKSFIPYSILITISIMIHYQMTYAILFMILATLIFVMKRYPKEDRKEIILKLGLGTIWGIILPSVIFLPAIEIYIESSRLSLQKELYNEGVFFTKVSYILFSGITLYGFIKLQSKVKKDKNIQLLDIFIVVTGIIPIIFEGVNEIWHGGKYMCFPFRFGFIPLFFLNLSANYYYSKYMTQVKNTKENIGISTFFYIFELLSFIMIIICGCCISYMTMLSNPAFGTSCQTVIVLIIYNMSSYFFFENLFCNQKYKIMIIYIFTIIEIIMFAFGFVGIKEEYRGYFNSDLHIFNAFDVLENFKEKLDFYSGYKYKDEDFIMLENTPLITNLPSNSSWILSSKEQGDLHTNLGYSRHLLRLNSNGGTIFSDAILNIKYIFSRKELKESIYVKIAENEDGIKLYESKNVLPIGIVYDANKDLATVPENLNKVQFSNWIYKNLFSKKDNILEVEDKKFTLNDANRSNNIIFMNNKADEPYIEFVFDVKGEKNLYFTANEGIDYLKFEISDDVYVFDPLNVINGIINLGIYKDEKVKVKVYFFQKEIDINRFDFITIDLNKYFKLFSDNIKTNYKTQKNEIYIDITVKDENKKIFLPISYDKNWIAENNGKEIEIENIMGSMISLKLEKGNNNIKLTLKNNTIKIGLIITIIAIIGLVITGLTIDKLQKFKYLKEIIYYTYIFVVVIFFIIVYIIGVIITFFN